METIEEIEDQAYVVHKLKINVENRHPYCEDFYNSSDLFDCGLDHNNPFCQKYSKWYGYDEEKKETNGEDKEDLVVYFLFLFDQ